MKLTIPDVVDRFAAYVLRYPAWGSLHVVLDEGNVRDCDVAWVRAYAREVGDKEGEELACLLAQMTRSQRCRLTLKAEEKAEAMKAGRLLTT